MNGNQHRDKSENHSLKLIFWHQKSPFCRTKVAVIFLMSRNQIYMKAFWPSRHVSFALSFFIETEKTENVKEGRDKQRMKKIRCGLISFFDVK